MQTLFFFLLAFFSSSQVGFKSWVFKGNLEIGYVSLGFFFMFPGAKLLLKQEKSLKSCKFWVTTHVINLSL